MTTRRRFLGTAVLAATAGPLESATAQETKAPAKDPDFLFVQSAKGIAFDKAKGRLVLKGVSRSTVFFSDRPERIAGHMDTKEFPAFWKEGKDSFQSNPPNATLSVFGEGQIVNVVMVLRNPVLTGDDLSYDIRVLQGEVPAKGGEGSLFIDIIGRPMTPGSVAGAERRAWRRY